MTDPLSQGSRGPDPAALSPAQPRRDAELPASPNAAGVSEDSPEALLGTTLADRYRLVELLGTGGMGAVYRAEHALIGRPVAIKLLSAQCCRQKEIRERFFREARVTTRIRHPNVLDVMDLGETPALRLYLVMELLHGQTLAERLADGPLPIDALVDVFMEAAEGLAAAHEVGVVHRDVSPANLFLLAPGRNTGPQVRVKILDFGIAFIKSEVRLTLPGEVMGTPYYVSPEILQKGASAVTPASDVYSLGATLFEALCGSPPFEAPTYTQVLLKHVTEPPPSVAARCPDVPPRLAELVEACLAKEPDERPGGMREVIRQLHSVGRDIGRRTSRRSMVPPEAERGEDAPPVPFQTLGTGLSAWKEYLRTVRAKGPLPPRQDAQARDMETAVAELEQVDESLEQRREALATSEAGQIAAEHRFSRAMTALREEEARLEETGQAVRDTLDAASAARRDAEEAFRAARAKVRGAEAAAGESEETPLAAIPEGLAVAYAEAGPAAGRLCDGLQAERGARETMVHWETERTDVSFQLRQLVSNAGRTQEGLTAAIARDKQEIRTLEETRAALWQTLIALATGLSRGR